MGSEYKEKFGVDESEFDGHDLKKRILTTFEENPCSPLMRSRTGARDFFGSIIAQAGREFPTTPPVRRRRRAKLT